VPGVCHAGNQIWVKFSMVDTSGPRYQWRLAVLISGAGRTLQNLVNVIDAGELDARIVSVVSSRPSVAGLDVAARAGIPSTVVSRSSFTSLEAFSQATLEAVDMYDPDLGIMAGYLRKVLVLPGWEGRILNIHPALLPQAADYAAGHGMFGDMVHQAVLDHGDQVSGTTVHVVTDEYDAGPPLAQTTVPVMSDDTSGTLGTRVFNAECDIYPQAIRDYCEANPGLLKKRDRG
jgi:formyltetrahydrofolate-dependent phosphoribosylglycinamide formyltransferase